MTHDITISLNGSTCNSGGSKSCEFNTLQQIIIHGITFAAR